MPWPIEKDLRVARYNEALVVLLDAKNENGNNSTHSVATDSTACVFFGRAARVHDRKDTAGYCKENRQLWYKVVQHTRAMKRRDTSRYWLRQETNVGSPY